MILAFARGLPGSLPCYTLGDPIATARMSASPGNSRPFVDSRTRPSRLDKTFSRSFRLWPSGPFTSVTERWMFRARSSFTSIGMPARSHQSGSPGTMAPRFSDPMLPLGPALSTPLFSHRSSAVSSEEPPIRCQRGDRQYTFVHSVQAGPLASLCPPRRRKIANYPPITLPRQRTRRSSLSSADRAGYQPGSSATRN